MRKSEILGYSDSRTLERKRNDILESAKELFTERGIEKTSMQMIAEKAGITRRSLYNYYDSKEQIAVDVQIINLMEISFFSNWDYRKWNSGEEGLYEAFIDNLEKALGPFRMHYLFINRFDTYFNQGYPDGRYVDFLQGEFEKLYGESNGKEKTPAQNWMVSSFLLSYFQRMVRRTLRETVNLEDLKKETRLVCSLFRNYV